MSYLSQVKRLLQSRQRNALFLLLPALLAVVLSAIAFEVSVILMSCAVLGFITFFLLLATRSRTYWLAGAITAAILASVATTHWPLRAAYAISRPAIVQVAAQVEVGKPLTHPFWIGTFRIARAELDKGVVCLWTGLAPRGRLGFVQQSSQEQQKFNTWSMLQLDSDWQFLAED